MKDLGCNAYRFSVEWSKIEPRQGEWASWAVAYVLADYYPGFSYTSVF